MLSTTERAALERWIGEAIGPALELPPAHRVGFIGKHVLARIDAAPIGDGMSAPRNRGLQTDEAQEELRVLAQEISSTLNAARQKSKSNPPASPIRALAMAMVENDNHVHMPAPVRRAVSTKRVMKWESSFVQADPRRQILEFFRPGDERGPGGLLKARDWTPSGKVTSTYFTVWRPTSLDAIRTMMSGQATGKSLNVKGKSAKQGKLSGFVPFLQISEEAHKARLGTSPPDAAIRVFYPSAEARAEALAALEAVRDEMQATAAAAQAALDAAEAAGIELDDDTRDAHLMKLLHTKMSRPEVKALDESGQGLEIPERLFVETGRRSGCVCSSVRWPLSWRDAWRKLGCRGPSSWSRR